MQILEDVFETEDDDKNNDEYNRPAETAEEEDGEDEGLVAASKGATLAESESPPPSEPCGCSADVGNGWLKAVEGEIEFSFAEALDLLEQAQNFDIVCDQHWQDLGALLRSCAGQISIGTPAVLALRCNRGLQKSVTIYLRYVIL